MHECTTKELQMLKVGWPWSSFKSYSWSFWGRTGGGWWWGLGWGVGGLGWGLGCGWGGWGGGDFISQILCYFRWPLHHTCHTHESILFLGHKLLHCQGKRQQIPTCHFVFELYISMVFSCKMSSCLSTQLCSSASAFSRATTPVARHTRQSWFSTI